MSAGRGSPRIPPFEGNLPDTVAVDPVSPSSIAVVGVTSAPYNYNFTPFRTTVFPLNQTAAPYADDNGLTSFDIPLGAIRGTIRGTYKGETGVGGRLGITLLWGLSRVAVSSIVNVPGLTFPSPADPNQVIVSRYVEEMSFPARTNDVDFAFRLPFWVPTIDDYSAGAQNLDTPFIPVEISVREAQVGVTPGSSSVTSIQLTVENYGQAMPASRM